MADSAENTGSESDARRARTMRIVMLTIWVARLGIGLGCLMVALRIVMGAVWRSFDVVMLVLSVLQVAVWTLVMMSSTGHLRELRRGGD